MASYIPNVKIPIENILQELDYARGRPQNRNTDIILPPYILDRRVIKAVQFENFDYADSYVKKCPTYISRYFFLEKVKRLKPMEKFIEIYTLLGYACLYKSFDCIRTLLLRGAKPFQPAYILEWGTSSDGEHIMQLTEKPSIVLLASIFHTDDIKTIAKTFRLFKLSEINFGIPVEIRQQHLQQPKGPFTKTTQYRDVWECFEREIDTKPGPTLINAKLNLKKIHSAYTINKLDQFIEPPKSKGKEKVKVVEKEEEGEKKSEKEDKPSEKRSESETEPEKEA